MEIVPENRQHIKINVQAILNDRFENHQKKRIIPHADRIQFACPYCGDSTRTLTKKRGNVYYNSYMYVCFRCGKKCSYDKLCKDYNITLSPELRMEIMKHLDENVSYKEYTENTNYKFDKLIPLDEITKLFSSGDPALQLTKFKPLQKFGWVHSYLVNRGITDQFHKDIFEATYWRSSTFKEPVLVILNRKNDYVLGAQIRNLKDGKQRVFKVFNYQYLYDLLYSAEMEINETVVYNKMSCFFNIMNVDFNKKITAFEGYLDSVLVPNSIGGAGVNTDFKFLENNNLEMRYFFDNDFMGFKKAEEKLKNGFSVFLWKKMIENLANEKRLSDPFHYIHEMNKIKDLNKLSEIYPDPYNVLNMGRFFSKDTLDIRWIPKTISQEKKYNKNYANQNKR